MVSYEYQELFYKSHQVKDILVVDANATITPATGGAPTITDATIEIHTEDIESESFQLDECLCAEDNLRFGLCESAKVEFRIKNKADIPNLKSSEYGDLLNIYLYFNGDSDTLFQIGQYACFKDDYTNNRKMREIELYDLNYTLNDLDITSWYNRYFSDGNRHQIILAIADLFNWINGTGDYANDDSSPKISIEIDPVYTLCNGAFLIGKTIESDTVTFGFFMQGLLEFNGCFGHITREGKFKFLVMESYDKTPCRTVTDDFRKPPTNYSDDNTWGIGQLDVYDRTNVKKFSKQNTDKKKPSIYVMVDPWVIADRESGDSATETALQKLLLTINHYNYNKSETECSGDLCIEVGDRYNVEFTQASQYDTRNWFRSYVLERHFSGIQSMHDTYTAKGDKKQPLYQIPNENWHVGDSTSATQGSGTGGVAELNDEHDRRLIEIMRNYGEPMLDEPTVTLTYNKGSSQVEIAWTDPADISTYSPLPVEWAGTIVVRKEGKAPIHRWGTEHSEYGGEVLVDSTTRDEYSQTAFVDDTIEPNKRYYYAIMPYFVALDDAQHPVKHYRWTKVFSVDTARILVAPTLFPIQETSIEGVDVTVAYAIPVLEVGQYEVIKLVAKKDSIPLSIADGDKAIDLTPTPGMIVNTATMTGLDENSHYYFVIFIEDDQGNTASSEPKSCETGESIIPEEIKEYVALINGCNGEGLDFFWKDYTINFPYGGYTDPKSFSYYNMRDVHYEVYNIVPSAFRSGYDDGYRYYTSHTTKFSLWIVNDNGTYKLYFRDYVPFIVGVNCSSFASDTGLYSSGRYNQNGGQYSFMWYVNSGNLVFPTGDDTVQRSDSSLVSLMEWCSKTFRNVNIYLDGVLISPAN